MCDTIRLKGGNSLETVEDFERHFQVDAGLWKHEYYGDIDPKSCLCQLNLERFMEDKKDIFEYDLCDWREIDGSNNCK